MTAKTTRRELLRSAFLLVLAGMVYVQVAPQITIDPCPSVGRTTIVTIDEMSTSGVWTVVISYSDGTTEPPVIFTDCGGGQVTTTPPEAAGGGTIVVTVTAGGDTTRATSDVSP